MHQSLNNEQMKKIIVIFTGILLMGCASDPSLQKYFVEKSESSDFIVLDLASSIIKTDKMSLTSEQKNALDSFDKLNILAFQKDSLNEAKFKEEKKKVKDILKNNEYQELMRFGNGSNGGAVYFVGKEDNIEEMVLFASGSETGFVVTRVLGDEMNPSKMLNLVDVIRKADLDLEQLKPLKEAFSNK